MIAFHSFLHALNEYSNLLLVLVTVAYVIVTWWTLRALKRTSLREREAKHLEDVKATVAEPLTRQIDELVRLLQGQRPIISVFETSRPAQNPQLGANPFEYSRCIREFRPEAFGLSEILYSDAKRNHFGEQLRHFEEFRDNFRTFAADCASFAAKMATEAAAESRAADGHIAVNAEMLIIECVSSLMQGLSIPHLDYRQTAPGGREVYGFQDRTNYIARGDQGVVDPWLQTSVEAIRQSWHDEGLSARAAELIRMESSARDGVEAIKFTHALSRDCAFIGGMRREA